MPDADLLVYVKKRGAVIDRITEIGLPMPGEQLRLVTRRKFNAVEFLTHVAVTERVEHLAAAIYSINYNAARLMVKMIDDGLIGSADILMSNLRNGAHREKEVVVRDLFERHAKIDLFFCSSHAKVMAIKTVAGNSYVIEGSGNHADNSRVEQYVIDNDDGVYRWTLTWMQEIREYLGQ
ncbi:hypothetical protein [Gemmobacter sp.]|uniref:hypothetical protein n=1 Tax=Gemmobacter sp. TaxID=1898957 RepID=UPI002AFFCF43|nr:hypothetical protein [Gemmobacter sp.]